jgi:hypothetical protein
MYNSKYPAPSNLTYEIGAGIHTHPGKNGFANNMVFGYKPPEAGIFRVMAVIAHHPVIIHFKSIGVGLFTVDQNIIT